MPKLKTILQCLIVLVLTLPITLTLVLRGVLAFLGWWLPLWANH